MNKLANDMYQATVRVEVILHLGSMVCSADTPTEIVEDSFNEDESLLACLGLTVGDGDSFTSDDILEYCLSKKKFGFAVKFATPTLFKTSDKSMSCSWGYYRTHWVYAETFEEAVASGIEWAYNYQKQFDLLGN